MNEIEEGRGTAKLIPVTEQCSDSLPMLIRRRGQEAEDELEKHKKL